MSKSDVVADRPSAPEQYLRTAGQDFEEYIDALRNEPLGWLGPLARINVFVGATNAGKSRFLRALARNGRYALIPGQSVATVSTITDLCTQWSTTREALPMQFMGSPPRDQAIGAGSPYLSEIRELAQPSKNNGRFIYDAEMFRRTLQSLQTTLTRSADDTPTRDAYASLEAYRYWADRIVSGAGVSEEFVAAVRALKGALTDWLAVAPIEVTTPQCVYIPTLRSAVRLFHPHGGTRIDEDILEATFRVNYGWGLGPDVQPEVFTGNRLSWAVQQERGGSREDRAQLRRFERFLADEFFGGKAIELIPRADTKDEYQRLAISIGDQEDRLLHEVGDGIQAIIILMYRLFTVEQRSWVFIEEPEINLHPGLQRIFLHALAHNEHIRAKELRIFMTTHSNHLLGTLLPETSDISIFSFQEGGTPGQFLVRPVLDRRHNPLMLLGVTNSSVFLANCSIWVEGITDRKYLRAYLQAYQNSAEFHAAGKQLMREDIHYAFLEYAGSNLAHYLFDLSGDESGDVPEKIRALALCNRIFLLADRDEGKEEKHALLRAAADRAEGHLEYHTTAGFEIENMIPSPILAGVLPQLVRAKVTPDLELDESAYQATRMGQYLRAVLGPVSPAGLVADSGTLATYYKNKLADLVTARVTWGEMSAATRELAIALYNFIERHNR